VVGDHAGSGVVVRLVLLLVVGLEQVVVDPVDPLPVERAELVVEVVVEAALVEEQPEVLAGQEGPEYLVAKRGGLLEADVLQAGRAQSNCIGILAECLFLQ
jgi:hypothetical protein